MSRFRSKTVNSNSMKCVRDFIKSNEYDANVSENKMFIFNVKKNDKNKIKLGDGKDNNHLNIMMSSKALLSNLSREGMFHIDGTYKITKNGFPLMVFGITDMAHTFHPIAFCVTSHESEADFSEFFNGIIKVAEDLDISFNPKYFVMDACGASANAVNSCFEDVSITMCWFHLKMNVRKHKHLITDEHYDEVLNDINALHFSLNESEFKSQWKEFKSKWNSKIKSFVTYFEKNWINGSFNTWQIYHSPAGYAKTDREF